MTPDAPSRFDRFKLGQPLLQDLVQEEPAAPVAGPTPSEVHTSGIFRVLLILLVLALGYTIYAAQALMIPIVLAAFLAMSLSPLVSGLSRWMPRALATTLIMAVGMLALGGAATLLIDPATEFLQQAPRTMKQLAPKLRGVMKPIEAASNATESLVKIGNQPAAPRSRMLDVTETMMRAPLLLAKALGALLLCFVFLLRGDDLLRRMVELSPTLHHKRNTVVIVRAIQTDTSRYLLTTTLINVLLGAATAGGLYLFGLKDPLLWGALAGLLNFIPYVGAMTMVILLAALGLLQAPTLGAAMLPAGFFLVLTAIEGQVITPTILGARLSLNPLAIVLWLILWGWLWGVAGVLLGVPLLMCLKIICERFDGTRWVARAIE